jgi:hypothetical protein
MAIRPARLRIAARARLAAYLALGLFTVAGLVGYGVYTLNSPPTWSDLPLDWFERPALQDPATWRMPGAKVVQLDLRGVRVKVIQEARQDVHIEGLTTATTSAKCPGEVREDAPLVVVHTPMNVVIHSTGVFAAEAGGGEELMVSNKGCGVWRITGVHRRLWLFQDGPGQIHAPSAEEVRVSSQGESLIRLAGVTRSLDAVVRGPGHLELGAAEGAINAQAWGRGRIDIASGFTSEARLFVKGPGWISHLGTVGALTAEARAGGKVRVAHVRGIASGSGDIEVSR